MQNKIEHIIEPMMLKIVLVSKDAKTTNKINKIGKRTEKIIKSNLTLFLLLVNSDKVVSLK